MPVLGSGHPQADIFLLKYAPTAAEIEEGVAFYGRAGNALMKSFKRLGIDPLAVYGTLCVKCPVADPALAAGECVERVVEELAIVQPRIIVVMGEPALETPQRARAAAGAARSSRSSGEIQQLTPTIDALYVPDIDDSLDSEESEARVLARLPRARRLVRGPAAATRSGPARSRARGAMHSAIRSAGSGSARSSDRHGASTDLPEALEILFGITDATCCCSTWQRS